MRIVQIHKEEAIRLVISGGLQPKEDVLYFGLKKKIAGSLFEFTGLDLATANEDDGIFLYIHAGLEGMGNVVENGLDGRWKLTWED